MKAVLRLRIVPNARKSEIVGLHGEAIKIKVQAPPVDGKANEALLEFLAAQLALPVRDIELIGGAKSRDKVVAIEGLDADDVKCRLLPPQ